VRGLHLYSVESGEGHLDIFKDGMPLPLSNIEIRITGSRSGKGDRAGLAAFFTGAGLKRSPSLHLLGL
jgi:hypothetical protein